MTSNVQLPREWQLKHLTPAEQRVVELISAGYAPKDTARELGRSLSTVRNQLYTAMKKLGLRNRYELVAYFRPVPPRQQMAVASETEAEAFAYAI